MSLTFTLESPGRAPVVLGAGLDDGLHVVEFDLGFPSARENVQARPGANGTIDRTRHHDSRTVTVGVRALDATLDEKLALRAMMSPEVEATLTIEDYADNEPPMQATVRPRSAARSFRFIDTLGVGNQVCQWSVPSGVFEATTERTITLRPSSGSQVPGREYDLTYPSTYPPAEVAGATTVDGGGSATAHPTIQLFGPCVGPSIEHIDALGKVRRLSFPGFSIADGDYLGIDTRTKTVRLNDDPAISQYGSLDFAQSEWWSIAPTTQTLRLLTESSTNPCQAVVKLRDAYI